MHASFFGFWNHGSAPDFKLPTVVIRDFPGENPFADITIAQGLNNLGLWFDDLESIESFANDLLAKAAVEKVRRDAKPTVNSKEAA